MNRQTIFDNVVQSFDAGYLDDDSLAALDRSGGSISPPPPTVLRASSSIEDLTCDSFSFDTQNLLVQSIHILTDNPQQPRPLSALASFDGGLEISYFGSWSLLNNGQFILDILRPLKERARVQSGLLPLVVDDVPFFVHPDGAKSGFSYTYKLTVNDGTRVKYWVLLHTSPGDSIPGVRIKCEYSAFRGRTLKDVSFEITHILDTLGFKVTRETLSRVDFNITVNRDLEDFNRAFDDNRILNRCSCARYGRKQSVESYRFGKNGGSVSFAVYDKTAELIAKYDKEKIDDISNFFGVDIQSLTRYEFRLSREFLYANEIDSFEDFLERFPAIVDYLTLNWFLVKDESEHKHKKRVELKLAPFWAEIRAAFLVYSITGQSFITVPNLKNDNDLTDANNKHYRTLSRRRPLRRFRRKLKSLFSIGLGCFVSAIALAVPPDSSFSRADFQGAITKYASYFSDKAYKSFVDRRIQYKDLDILYSQLQVVNTASDNDLFSYQENGAIYV